MNYLIILLVCISQAESYSLVHQLNNGDDVENKMIAQGDFAHPWVSLVKNQEVRERIESKIVLEKYSNLSVLLGHDSFNVREQSTWELKKMGRVVIPHLKKTLEISKDLEVIHRVNVILFYLSEQVIPPTPID